jgi:non-ribosomal peptide synthase protein (TIGR01720 family)
VEDVLLTGLSTAVADWRRRHGQDGATGMLVELEGHGRVPLAERDDLSRTAGWFTNAHPVRLDPGLLSLAEMRAGGDAAGRAIKRIKEQLRAVPGDGLGYGMLRHLNPETAPHFAGLSTPQIGFNYLGRFGGGGAGEASGADSAEDGEGQMPQLRDWQTVGQGVTGSDENAPVTHPLEVMGLVRDDAEGPHLCLIMSWPGDLLAESAVQELIDGWAAMLAGLAAHAADSGGGHAPSDFPLVELSQDELDEFEAAAMQFDEGA